MEQIPGAEVSAVDEPQTSPEAQLQDQLADMSLNQTLQPETAPQSPTSTSTKIFVGGLLRTTTAKTLREYFEQFGQIDEAVVKAH